MMLPTNGRGRILSYPIAPSPVHISSNRLEGLNSDLLVQVPGTSIDPTRALIRDLGVGVVYTIETVNRTQRLSLAGSAIDQTRRHNPDADILIDAARYSGRSRTPATAGSRSARSSRRTLAAPPRRRGYGPTGSPWR